MTPLTTTTGDTLTTDLKRGVIRLAAGIPLTILGVVLAIAGATRTVHNTFTGAPIHHPAWGQAIVGGTLALVGLVLVALGVAALARAEATRP